MAYTVGLALSVWPTGAADHATEIKMNLSFIMATFSLDSINANSKPPSR